jgi:hypothetical protein
MFIGATLLAMASSHGVAPGKPGLGIAAALAGY